MTLENINDTMLENVNDVSINLNENININDSKSSKFPYLNQKYWKLWILWELKRSVLR